MSASSIVAVALKALRRNLFRTVPTMIGIAVGVTAVITIVALGTGAQTAIEDACRRVISTSLTQFLEWPTDIPGSAALASFAFAAFIGIFFGWYPARRAAEIDPIDALRFE